MKIGTIIVNLFSIQLRSCSENTAGGRVPRLRPDGWNKRNESKCLPIFVRIAAVHTLTEAASAFTTSRRGSARVVSAGVDD